MKKALALVLALVLALSMAVSAFAADVILDLDLPDPEERTYIQIVEPFDEDDTAFHLYTRWDYSNVDWDDPESIREDRERKIEYYIALDPAKKLEKIELTANGNVTAELVKYDPETMFIDNLEYNFSIVDAEGNVAVVEDIWDGELLCCGHTAETAAKHKVDCGCDDFVVEYCECGDWGVHKGELDNLCYDCAVAIEKQFEALDEYKNLNAFAVKNNTANINIVKITVENNFSAAYTEGTIGVKATWRIDKKTAYPVKAELTVINDVCIFEYEMVKWAAERDEALVRGTNGYSDYFTAKNGYGIGDWEYDYEELREWRNAQVVSTTAFRAIEGKDLTVNAYKRGDAEINVTLKEVAKGQKGVNFFSDIIVDVDKDATHLNNISFGFYGNQKINGKFEIEVNLEGVDYFDLREAFGIKVEEEDIINYYVVNQDNEVVKTIKVDYMTDDITENVEFTIEGENEKLGWYTICLEVPASETETETEANPNTGAESVVGVVAALAVVSVATAAAVSLKK